MRAVLEEVERRLLNGDWDNLRELCRDRWGCPEEPVVDLIDSLTAQGFLKVFGALEEIRRQPREARCHHRVGLGLFIDAGLSDLDQQRLARKAIETILLNLPE